MPEENLSFFAKNAVDLVKIAKQAFKKLDDQIQHTLGLAYSNYETQLKAKYSSSKSYFTSNQPTDLYDYYVGTNLNSNNEMICDADTDKIFIKSRHSVISGSGGCGKSVLMRHLLLDSLKRGEYAPILIELRDLNVTKNNLHETILESLRDFGLNLPKEYIEKALKTGKFLLLLDGFDEVNYQLRKNLSRDIKKFITQYNDCPIIISTRPDDIFKGIHDLTIFEVSPLSLNLAIKLIEKISFERETKEKFVEQLKKNLFESHESFLSNPLLLSIMLLTYSDNANIPSKLSLFYNQAYEALFHKHDASKGSYERQRKTNFDIQDFSNVFSIFSLQTYDKRIFKTSRTKCLDLISTSSKILNLPINADDYLQDLLSATCLLIEDGLEIAYSHRSFQEYFVALYLSKAKQDIQEQLLHRYSKNAYIDNVIQLLFEINQDLVEEKLIIPQLKNIFTRINLKNKVGIIHFYKFINIFFDAIYIDDSGCAYGNKDLNNDFWIFDFVRKNYSSYERLDESEYEEIHAEFSNELGYSYNLKKLNSRSPIIKRIANSDLWLSIKAIENLHLIYQEIIQKQNKKEKTISSILNLKTT